MYLKVTSQQGSWCIKGVFSFRFLWLIQKNFKKPLNNKARQHMELMYPSDQALLTPSCGYTAPFALAQLTCHLIHAEMRAQSEAALPLFALFSLLAFCNATRCRFAAIRKVIDDEGINRMHSCYARARFGCLLFIC